MSSTVDDSHSPLITDVHRQTISLDIEQDNGKEGEYSDQNNKKVREGQDNSDALQNSVILPETDLLGLGNELEVKGGANDVKAIEISKSEVPISPILSDRIGIEDDRQREVVYEFPPGLSSLNVNGRPKFELVTVRDNGRLQMFMVPNLSPQLVRSPGRNGRLKMWLLNDDRHGGEQALPPVRRSI